VVDPDAAVHLKLLGDAEIALLHALEHESNHLLPAGEPWVPESKVDRMHQAVVEEALLERHLEVEEGPVGSDLLGLEDLVLVPLRVVIASDELVGLLLLEFLEVGFLGGLAVGGDEAGVPQELLRDVELLTKVLMAMSQVAEEGDPLIVFKMVDDAGDPDPGGLSVIIIQLRRNHNDQKVHPDLLVVLPLKWSSMETGPVISVKSLGELFPGLNYRHLNKIL
jgi:hypothetical protein